MTEPTPAADDVLPRDGVCDCGEPATVPVIVHWQDGARTYRFCEACAQDVVETGIGEYRRYGMRSNVNGPNGTWCNYCTPRKLYHPTDHPARIDGCRCMCHSPNQPCQMCGGQPCTWPERYEAASAGTCSRRDGPLIVGALYGFSPDRAAPESNGEAGA